MLAGSMMIPEPIMFTATRKVSWIRFIFFAALVPAAGLVEISDVLATSAALPFERIFHSRTV